MTSFSDSSYRLMLSEIMDDDDEYNNDEDDMTDTDDQQLLVDDSRLSPLQLPARASCSPRRRRARDLSCDSTSTVTQIPPPTNPTTDPVGPSSFLKHQQSSPLLSCNTKKNNSHGNQQQDHFTYPKNRVIKRKGNMVFYFFFFSFQHTHITFPKKKKIPFFLFFILFFILFID